MDENNSRVDDDELNQMIADLKTKQSTMVPPVSPAGPVPVPVPNSSSDGTTPVVTPPISPVPEDTVVPPIPPVPPMPIPAPEPTPEPAPAPMPIEPPVMPPAPTPVSPAGSNLDTIKQDAISELRPLVDKLNLLPEDRFNTILLIIRSTDDVSLLPAAHTAAKQITDDGRRAQALLDVIKEIDFFKQNSQS